MGDYDTTPKEGATSELKTPIASTEKVWIFLAKKVKEEVHIDIEKYSMNPDATAKYVTHIPSDLEIMSVNK